MKVDNRMREVERVAEEWPRVGVGGDPLRWRGTIHGDRRRFAKVINQLQRTAYQGGGWRGKPRPLFAYSRIIGGVATMEVSGEGILIPLHPPQLNHDKISKPWKLRAFCKEDRKLKALILHKWS